MTKPVRQISESVLYSLRELYAKHGYSHYKMNKFEEYDLYAKNKEFLTSENVITFTDVSGKLLALKPDVTISIVKNAADGLPGMQKLYYDENVYRVTKGSRNFREIMQVGLECIGSIDRYSVYEVLKLALDSLDTIHPDNVLSVSHVGLLSELMDSLGVPAEKKDDVLHCIGEKNLHELHAMVFSLGISEKGASVIAALGGLRGTTGERLEKLVSLVDGLVSEKTLSDFVGVIGALKDEKKLQIDFSVVGDIHYYNGFLFKGFVNGMPSGVLSGGQYDLLMRRMDRTSGAIGFAVYMDMIDQYSRREGRFDVDDVLLYGAEDDPAAVAAAVEKLNAEGESVLTDRAVPFNVKYRRLLKLNEGGLEVIEENA